MISLFLLPTKFCSACKGPRDGSSEPRETRPRTYLFPPSPHPSSFTFLICIILWSLYVLVISFTCRIVRNFVCGIMIDCKQIIASFYHLLLVFRETRKSAWYPSSLTAVAYNVFDNIRVIAVYKYGVREDAKMKLHVPVSGCLILGSVCFGYCPARAQR